MNFKATRMLSRCGDGTRAQITHHSAHDDRWAGKRVWHESVTREEKTSSTASKCANIVRNRTGTIVS